MLMVESGVRRGVIDTELLAAKLISGTAEVFCVAMVRNKKYSYFDQNFAEFSLRGCR